MEMLPSEFEWNQLVLRTRQDQLHFAEGLVAILAWAPSRSMRAVGTAFIIASRGNRAVAISAAHVFEGVHSVQQPRRHHPSALKEFVPNAEVIDLDRNKLRVLCMGSSGIEFCIVDSLVCDRTSDLALLTLHTEEKSDKRLILSRSYILDRTRPKIGDIVAVLGYADMDTVDEYKEGDFESFTMRTVPVVRVGRVKTIYPQGHSLCRGPCVETTIPVSFQMSGGPACLTPREGASAVPFGLVSSEIDNSPAVNSDRSCAGSSIISLLPHRILNETEERREVLFELLVNATSIVKN